MTIIEQTQCTRSPEVVEGSSPSGIIGEYSMKLLVVDDCKHIRGFVKAALNPKGIDVELAESGVEALKRCQSETYDLIVIDLNMPQMNGIETLRAIRNLGVTTPAVAFSAHDSSTAEGANEFSSFISKPIDRHELVRLVKSFDSPKPQ